MAHSSTPWKPAKCGGTIICDDNELGPHDEEALDYYGGFVVAETVAEKNMPLIMAAPALYEKSKQVCNAIRTHYSHCPQLIACFGYLEEVLADIDAHNAETPAA
jgi:hypothetical protein